MLGVWSEGCLFCDFFNPKQLNIRSLLTAGPESLEDCFQKGALFGQK